MRVKSRYGRDCWTFSTTYRSLRLFTLSLTLSRKALDSPLEVSNHLRQMHGNARSYGCLVKLLRSYDLNDCGFALFTYLYCIIMSVLFWSSLTACVVHCSILDLADHSHCCVFRRVSNVEGHSWKNYSVLTWHGQQPSVYSKIRYSALS